MGGQQQRRALSAAESALRALAGGDAERARGAAAKASALDQLGVYAAFGGLVRRAAAEVEQWGGVQPETVAALREALAPGPLAAAVEEWLG